MARRPLSQSFLEALDASAPDTLISSLCVTIGIKPSLLRTWRTTDDEFRGRFDDLTSDEDELTQRRRSPLGDEELGQRLAVYLRELELLHLDTGTIDRTRAAKEAGVSLTSVIRAGDEDSSGFSPEFKQQEEEVLLRQIVKVEDMTANLGAWSKEQAEEQGYTYQQMSQNTTFLKSRSKRHMIGRINVEGKVQHEHQHLLSAVNLFRELHAVQERFLPAPQPKVKLIEEKA